MASGGLDLKATGAQEMTLLGKDLKAAGASGLRKELLRAGREMGKPIRAEIAESARTTLPRRGGLALLVSNAKVRVSVRLTGRNVGVSFVGRLDNIDDGTFRHPVYGRGPWVAQRVRPGYWTRVFDGPGARIAHEQFLRAVDAVARRLASGG